MMILVTGGSGFIGSNVVPALLERGDEVVVLDNFSGRYDAYEREQLLTDAGADVVRGDIRSLDMLEDLLATGIEGVLHLAARTGVRESLAESLDYESVNIGGTATLLEALRKSPGTGVVFASSSSVYGERNSGPFLESEAADQPVSPYAASKRAGELLCYSAHYNWGTPVTCLRLFTVYGPRQRPGMAIARFVRQLVDGEPLTVFGNGDTSRDYTWVGDVSEAMMAALDNPGGYNVVNIGGGHPISLADLVRTIGKIADVEYQIEHLPMQEGDVPLTFADVNAARRLFGWAPKVALLEGLERYIRWVREEQGEQVSRER